MDSGHPVLRGYPCQQFSRHWTKSVKIIKFDEVLNGHKSYSDYLKCHENDIQILREDRFHPVVYRKPTGIR